MRSLAVIVVFICVSCELIVDVDVPYDGDKVVVNAVQRTDSTWSVYLSLTRNIVGPEYYGYVPVNYANVTIHNPDGTTETLTLDGTEGVFRGKSYPQPGQKYSISVNANGRDDVSAEMTMPGAVPIVDVKWDSTDMDGGTSQYYANVPFTLTFQDPPDVKNFYSVQVYTKMEITYYIDNSGNTTKDTIDVVREVWLDDDPGIATEDDRKLYFSDKTFDGRTYVAHFNNQFIAGYNQEKVLEIQVWLLSMSEENFKYQETRQLQDDVFGDPFAQPVLVYSNTSNGFGIFAGNSIDFRTWKR